MVAQPHMVHCAIPFRGILTNCNQSSYADEVFILPDSPGLSRDSSCHPGLPGFTSESRDLESAANVAQSQSQTFLAHAAWLTDGLGSGSALILRSTGATIFGGDGSAPHVNQNRAIFR